MATRLTIGSVSRRLPATVGAGATPAALVAALTLPLLFLHISYQPSVTLSIGSTRPQIVLSDVAIALVALAALATGLREGFAPLRPGRWLWITGGALCIWALVALAYGRHQLPGYPVGTHAVGLAKWIEYALLAPALPLVLRRRRDVDALLCSLATWSVVATVCGMLGFFGINSVSQGNAGQRQASLLGWLDFAALSGAALLAGLVALLQPGAAVDRRLARVLAVSGAIGLVLAGSLSAFLGFAVAAALLAVWHLRAGGAGRRRAAAALVALVLVAAGSITMRSADLSAFKRFVGKSDTATDTHHVQTYAHRTLLAYLGLRIWEGHPLLGVGWQGSRDPDAYLPYIAAAKKRFPDEPAVAFPSRTRIYGVQLAYLEALSDLGIVGFLLWLSPFVAGLLLAARALRSGHDERVLLGTVAGTWIVLVLGCWTAQGIVAGLPLDALNWLALGLAATAAAWAGSPAATRRASGTTPP